MYINIEYIFNLLSLAIPIYLIVIFILLIFKKMMSKRMIEIIIKSFILYQIYSISHGKEILIKESDIKKYNYFDLTDWGQRTFDDKHLMILKPFFQEVIDNERRNKI